MIDGQIGRSTLADCEGLLATPPHSALRKPPIWPGTPFNLTVIRFLTGSALNHGTAIGLILSPADGSLDEPHDLPGPQNHPHIE
jgi:hypothetical protein